MRINPSTGEIVSYQNNYCPYCEADLEDENYEWCDKCNEYVGIVYRGVVEQTMTQSEYDRKVDDLEKRIKEIEDQLDELENSSWEK